MIPGTGKNKHDCLECKEYVKYLGILIDKNLNWKPHISIISRLRRLVPFKTLTQIYQSLVYHYLSYGLSLWGQASKTYLDKLLVLQKRALRLIHLSTNKNEHAVPLFIKINILPISFLYVESISNLIHNVKNKTAPANIQNLFRNVSDVHSYNTRSAAAGNFYIMHSRLELLKSSFSRFGAKLWNIVPSNLKELNNKNFKKQTHN